MHARKPLAKLKTVSIQVVVFAVLLLVLEGAARYAEPSFKKPAMGLNLHPFPYFMFGAGAHQTGFVWQNVITNETLPSKVKFNNYGYVEDFDYQMVPTADYLKTYAKKPGETLVLITGGSVVHGVGASANNMTIAARLERHLNENPDGRRYRVINMGMGSWIAYQQFIGLSMFGLPLNPDWIVVMDGHNDAAVPCAHGSGAGNPLLWPKMLYFLQGGSVDEVNPKLKAIARYSALFRIASGIDPQASRGLPNGMVVDDKDPDKRFNLKLGGLKFSEQDTQLEFYIQAQRNVLALFSRANVILSTQPLMWGNAISEAYRPAFGPGEPAADRAKLRADLDRYIAENANKACSPEISSQLLGYFMGRSAFRMEELAAEEQAASSRKVLYVNTESAFPFDLKLRGRYFIDNAHMSDPGQDRIGDMFANAILSAERGAPFDYAAFVKANGPS